jgi:hypothetical protein
MNMKQSLCVYTHTHTNVHTEIFLEALKGILNLASDCSSESGAKGIPKLICILFNSLESAHRTCNFHDICISKFLQQPQAISHTLTT